MKKMKIVVDENIAFAHEAFSSLGEVTLMHGRKIDNSALKDAGALIVRSITEVNAALLEATPVKFVGTATIGTDHVDLDYLKRQGIAFSDAKGCNADAVAEYVFTALLYVINKKGIELKGKSIGVIGVGNIGSRVVRYAKALGLKVLQNDPPRERQGGSADFVGLTEALQSDIVTFHVPLNMEGIDKTYHLINKDNLKLLKKDAILINASRGAVVDNQALLGYLNKNSDLSVILDVWENEPDIDTGLLVKTDIASAHIAGYSLEGKVNGTMIVRGALCEFLGCTDEFHPQLPVIENPLIELEGNPRLESSLLKAFSSVYNIKDDDLLLKKMHGLPNEQRRVYFDDLRKNYRLRREFSNFAVKINQSNKFPETILKEFRFSIL